MSNIETETAAEAERYDRWAAQAYLNSGDLDDAGSAYWHLYYREARKGLGRKRACQIGEIALDLARTEGRTAAIEAIPLALAAMRDEPGAEEAVAGACVMQAQFRAGIADLMSA